MDQLHADVCAIQELASTQKKSMFALYASYYDGCNEASFYDDLMDKHWVIILLDSNGILRGFSTLSVAEHRIAQQTMRSVFSGDTIIQHEFWGEQVLPQAWCRFVGELKAQQADVPLYWFLIVKGHRTYRYLRVFSKKFYPVHSEPTPYHIQTIMDHLGQARFAEHYRKETGLIQFKRSHGHLKKQWLGIDAKALKNSDVNFFLQRNSGHYIGDELVCLTELTESNLKRHALVAFSLGLHDE